MLECCFPKGSLYISLTGRALHAQQTVEIRHITTAAPGDGAPGLGTVLKDVLTSSSPDICPGLNPPLVADPSCYWGGRIDDARYPLLWTAMWISSLDWEADDQIAKLGSNFLAWHACHAHDRDHKSLETFHFIDV